MGKNDNKTQPTNADVLAFVDTLDEAKKADSLQLIDLMKEVSGEDPVLWGSSIIGFGKYHYRYASGREGDSAKIGFSPRKAALTLYFSSDINEMDDEFSRLGTYTRGVGCVYIKKLSDIDMAVLSKIARKAYEQTVDFDAKAK